MQNKGRGKAAKVVNFVTKWLNLCLSTVLLRFAIEDEEFREHEPIKVIALADIDRKAKVLTCKTFLRF